MTAKTSTPSSSTATSRPAAPTMGFKSTTPQTTEEYLERIDAMGRRISGFIQFICQVGNLNGVSLESKDKAIVAFYDHLVIMERRLERIHSNFQLE